MQFHVPRDTDTEIKSYSREEGKEVVVGIKGSGKTELRKFIENNDDDALVFNLDTDHSYLSIDASKYDERSGRLKNALALMLVSALTEEISNTSEKATSWVGKMKHELHAINYTVMEKLNNIPNAVTLDFGIGSVDLAKLLHTEHSPIVKSAWDEAHNELMKLLKGRRVYIMIDDAEDVFPRLEANPDFLEGLVRAISDLNHASGSTIHALLFVKYGVWRQWFKNPREYDKVNHLILILRWNHESLCELIARRIHERTGNGDIDFEQSSIEDLWAEEFSWKGDFNGFSKEITRYCVSGPRDMIALCNKMKEVAGTRKMTLQHLYDVVADFSEEKVTALHSDFGDVYPRIHDFVDNVFKGIDPRLAGSEVAKLIEEKAVTDNRLLAQLGKERWFSYAGKEKVTEIMYEIGLIGIVESEDRHIYSLEDPVKSRRSILDSELVVHPAFRPYLGIDDE